MLWRCQMKQYEDFDFPEQYRSIAEEYVNYKHSLGFKYSFDEQRKINSMLNYIYNNIEENPFQSINKEIVENYARMNNGERPRTAHIRQSHIRQFCIYLNLKGINAYVYPNELVQTGTDFIPYIFTREEICKILYYADRIGPNKNKFVNTPYVYPAIIRVLYGCGLRIGETLKLLTSEVDLENNVLIITKGKNDVSRYVPISCSLSEYLYKYNEKVERENNPYFFPARHGEHYAPCTFSRKFKKLEVQAGIHQLPSGKYPRVHDLRHTFCVHALEKMINESIDSYCALPGLSTYVGHKGLESTEKYLRLTKQYFIEVLKYSEHDAERIFPEVAYE